MLQPIPCDPRTPACSPDHTASLRSVRRSALEYKTVALTFWQLGMEKGKPEDYVVPIVT